MKTISKLYTFFLPVCGYLRACVYAMLSLLECKYKIEESKKKERNKFQSSCCSRWCYKLCVSVYFCSLFSTPGSLLCESQHTTLINKDFPCSYIACSEFFIRYPPKCFPFRFSGMQRLAEIFFYEKKNLFNFHLICMKRQRRRRKGLFSHTVNEHPKWN